jgi:subtilisin family serine protease
VGLTVLLFALALLVGKAESAKAGPALEVMGQAGPEAVLSTAVAEARRRILIRFEPGTPAADRVDARETVDAEFVDSYSLVPRLQLIEIPEGVDRAEALAALRDRPEVTHAEPDLVRRLQVSNPNDTFYKSPYFYLWGLNNTGQTFTLNNTSYTGTPDADIDGPEAWDLSRGSPNVRVAVIDSGMQLNHPDLAANLWTNPGEIPGNGVDDDGNGRIDDVNGWDFINNDNDPSDDDGHGTHVAGTVGAVGNNNTGVTGVAWNVKLIPLKACDADGFCPLSATIAALNYAVARGVKISNNSYGGIGSQSTSERNAITAARDAGHLFVAAAGNDNKNTDLPGNSHYPSNYTLDNIISVASTTPNDGLSSFSNFGATSVDLGAPGSQIVSTVPNNAYGSAGGTSMASPHVAGVAALIKARKPTWSYSQIRDRLLGNTRPLTALSQKTVTGGMLNAFDALNFASDPPSITAGPSGSVAATSASFSFTGETVGAGTTFQCKLDSAPWGTCSSPATYSDLAGGGHTFQVRQTDQANNTSESGERTWTVDTIAPDAPQITDGPTGFVSSKVASFSFTGEASANFQCRLDAGNWGTCSSPAAYTDLSEGDHTFEVRQMVSFKPVSEPASRTWTVDTIAPDAPQITNGPTGFVSSKVASFSFTGEASANFQCRLDAGNWGTCSSPAAYSDLAEGSHSFEVRQTDQASNTSESGERTWTVDTIAPNAPEITSGPSNPSGSAEATFTFTGEPEATFECSKDEGARATCTSPKSLSALGVGPHAFEVRQTDEAGNTSEPAKVEWQVVLAIGQPTIDSGPEGKVNSTSAVLEFSGEAGSTFRCRVDDGSFVICESPFEVTGLAAGDHLFEVKQTDELGNTSLPTSRSWSVLKVATLQPTVLGTDETGAIVFGGAPQGFSYLCSINGSELVPCENPLLPLGLTDGTYELELLIQDEEGNRSDSIETSIEINGAPSPPTGNASVSINQGAKWTSAAKVDLAVDWPTGARKVLITNSTTFPASGGALAPKLGWALTSGQGEGERKVSVRFLGAGDTEMATVSDTIFLDPNRPRLKSAKAEKRRGKDWWTTVKASDSGSGLAKLAFSTGKSRPNAKTKPSKVVKFTKTATVKAKLSSAPRWVEVRDRAGNGSGWRAVKQR